MKKNIRFCIGILFILYALILAGCVPAAPQEFYIFAVNMGDRPVDIRTGETHDPFLVADALPPGAASKLCPAAVSGIKTVSYRYAGEKEWQRMPQELAAANFVLSGQTFACIVIDARGFLRLVELGDDAAPGARVAIVNGCRTALAAVGLWSGDGNPFPALLAGEIPPGRATRFASVVPGTYRVAGTPVGLSSGSGAVGPDPDASGATVTCGEATYCLVLFSENEGRPFVRQIPVAMRDRKDAIIPLTAAE